MAAAGIPTGLVRYSAGIEDVEDLRADLDRALAVLLAPSMTAVNQTSE